LSEQYAGRIESLVSN